MSTSFALTGRTQVVRLSDVPVELRRKVADLAVEKWGLSGMEELQLRLAAERGGPAELSVDEAKVAYVASGKQPPGPFPKLEDLDPDVRKQLVKDIRSGNRKAAA